MLYVDDLSPTVLSSPSVLMNEEISAWDVTHLCWGITADKGRVLVLAPDRSFDSRPHRLTNNIFYCWPTITIYESSGLEQLRSVTRDVVCYDFWLLLPSTFLYNGPQKLNSDLEHGIWEKHTFDLMLSKSPFHEVWRIILGVHFMWSVGLLDSSVGLFCERTSSSVIYVCLDTLFH